MPSETIGPRARVLLRNMPVDIGGAKARVSVAEVDIVAKGPDGILDLEDKNPKIDIHAARAIVPGTEVNRVAKQNATASGPVKSLDIRLLGSDRFEATGTVEGGIPFSATGKVGAAGGKLAFKAKGLDVSQLGVQVHLDIPGRQAKVAVPAGILESALRGEPVGAPKAPASGPKAGWPLVSPKIAWSDAKSFRLQSGLRLGADTVPVSAKVTLGVGNEDAWLRFGLSDVRLKAQGADIAVDLPARTAKVTVGADLVTAKVQEAAKRELQDPRLSWNGPNSARLEGNFPIARFLGQSPAGAEKLHMVANATLAAKDGKIQANLQDVTVTGKSLSFVARPQQNTGTVRVSTRFIADSLKAADLGGFAVKSFNWPAADQWKLEGDLSGTALTASGGFEQRDGKFVFHVDSLETGLGGDKVGLQLDPAANLIRASIPEKALAAMMGGSAPLEGMTLRVRKGGDLQAAGKLGLWKLKVPVKLDGKLSLGADGQPRYAIDRTNLYGVDVSGAMRLFGLTLGSLDKKGSWQGNTLLLKPGGLPAGTKLASLETGNGVLHAGLRPNDALPGGAKGIRFDGRNLEVDPAVLLPLPGRVTAAKVDNEALTVDVALDRQKLQKLVAVPGGVTFDGAAFRAEPSAVAGRAVPGKLLALSAGAGGAEATFALDDSVFAPLSKLPAGVKFDGAGFRVDPKQGKDLPGRLTRVSGGPEGLALAFGLTASELKGKFDLGKTGVAWDGQAITIDPSHEIKGLKATGATILDGDLVVEVGDGKTRLPESTPEKSVTLRHKGRARIQGMLIEDATIEIRPKTPDAAWSLQDIAKSDIKVLGGKVIVPAKKLDELIRAKLGRDDYKKFRPEFDGRRLTIRVPALIGSLPLALRFERSGDGKLQLAPSGFFGSIPLLEWPQRLIGLLLTPVSWLIPGVDGLKIDLKAASGVNLPELKGAEATPEGLVLDFGDAPPEN